MRILVVSLLRLGDIIQQEPLLRGLREKYPQAEIHLLINKQFQSVQAVLGNAVDKYVYLDREALQRGVCEASFNILWSFEEIKKTISELNSQNYSQAYNFTHNKLSAYLLGSLAIPFKRGLYFSEGRFEGIQNSWLKYFNDRFSGVEKSLFHYVELLGRGFGIPLEKIGFSGIKKEKVIYLQTLTSNKKKNWGLDKFRLLREELSKCLGDYQVRILCAEFEHKELLRFFDESVLEICDLGKAKELLQSASLLVSGDTSIKHLAAQVGTPIVELALGSSDSTKTGAFATNSVVVQSQAPCFPCKHSDECHQKSHLCSEDVEVGHVFAACWDMLSREAPKKTNEERELERIVWSLYLDGSATPFDTAFQKTSLLVFQERTKAYLYYLERLVGALPLREDLLNSPKVEIASFSKFITIVQEILKSQADHYGYFQDIVDVLTGRFTRTVQILDKLQDAVIELQNLIECREQVSRKIQNISMEGVFYAKGIGRLSVDSFTEDRNRSEPSCHEADV